MNKSFLKVLFAILIIALVPLALLAQKAPGIISVQLGGDNTDAGAGCSDFYKYGNVSVAINAERLNYNPGDNIKITSRISNINDYPIADGGLFIQIFKKGERGDISILEFFGKEDISLLAKGEKDVVFQHSLPAGLTAGRYYVKATFVVDSKIEIAQAISPSFNIKSSEKNIAIDSASVRIGKEIYNPKTSDYKFSAGNPIDLSFSIKNESASAQKIKIAKRIYKWNSFKPDLTDIKEDQGIEIGPGATKDIVQTVKNLREGLYVFHLTISAGNNQYVIAPKLMIEGNNPTAMLTFMGIKAFPIKKDVANSIFSCFRSISDTKSFEGKISLVLRDEGNRIIGSSNYEGKLTARAMAIKADFTPNKKYGNVWIDAFIYDKKGDLRDSATFKFDCSAITDPERFEASVTDKGILQVRAFNSCDTMVETKMAVEIFDSANKLVFFEPSFYGKEFNKQLNLKTGNYKLKITGVGLEKELEFSLKPQIGIGIVSGIILILVLGAGFWLWKNKKKEEEQI